MTISNLLLLGLAIISSVVGRTTIETNDYAIWTIPDGVSNKDVSSTQNGAALIGGGSDCIPAFNWMINHANGGDFVILRVGGTDAYNDFVYDLSTSINQTLNSVSTISFKNRNASYDKTLLSFVENAELIFFAGGDQSKYIDMWVNTPLQELIQKKLPTTTVGGTSAGLAILGEWIYSAAVNTAYSDESLENPYIQYMTIADKFLNIPFMQGVITDTHFGARDRMGRYLTFLARILTDHHGTVSVVRGVALDEQTALLLDTNTGMATTVGNGNGGHGYICLATQLPEVCQPALPLTFSNIQCTRVSAQAGDVFSFKSWSGEGVAYVNQVTNGKIVTAPYGP